MIEELLLELTQKVHELIQRLLWLTELLPKKTLQYTNWHKYINFIIPLQYFTNILLSTAAKILLKLTPFTCINTKLIILNTFNTESECNYRPWYIFILFINKSTNIYTTGTTHLLNHHNRPNLIIFYKKWDKLLFLPPLLP